MKRGQLDLNALIRPAVPKILLSVFLSVLLATLLGLNTLVMKTVYDRLFIKLEASVLFSTSLILAIFIVGISVTKILRNHTNAMIKLRINKSARETVTQKIVQKQYSYFIGKNSGEITKRIVEDCHIVSDGLTRIYTGMSSVFIVLAWMGVFFISVSWVFPMLVGTFAFCLAWFLIWKKPIGKSSLRIGQAYGKLYSMIHEAMSGMKMIKLELLSKNMEKSLAFASGKMRLEFTRNSLFHNLLWSVNGLLVWIVTLIILYSGMNSLKNGDITVGAITVVLMLLWQILEPMYETSQMLISSEEMNSALRRIEEYLEGSEETSGQVDASDLEHPQLTAHDVLFEYPGSRFSLRIPEFTIKPGEVVGIFGKTGDGKSSLTNLLLRLFDPTSGTITLGGIGLPSIKLSSLRETIVLVPQEINLYPLSIRSNIDLEGKLDDSQIWAILEALDLMALVKGARHGLDTVLGDGGLEFSGGEKQRIGIARAFAKKPKIFIFDEITANLDPAHAGAVMESILKMDNTVSRVFITHDLSVLPHLDRFYMLKSGLMQQVKKSGNCFRKEDILALY
jgi:ABC-type bacteriocin/lantibiotic exporter with double-glycine peptidase domain